MCQKYIKKDMYLLICGVQFSNAHFCLASKLLSLTLIFISNPNTKLCRKFYDNVNFPAGTRGVMWPTSRAIQWTLTQQRWTVSPSTPTASLSWPPALQTRLWHSGISAILNSNCTHLSHTRMKFSRWKKVTFLQLIPGHMFDSKLNWLCTLL